MRFLCSCSAVLVLAACGGPRARDPFAYDTRTPTVRDQGIVGQNARVRVHAVSFAGIDGFLAVPSSAGPHPAVLFLHGAGGTRRDLLLPAVQLALRGAVTMTISQPNDAATYRPLVVRARRALDVLAARADVDPARLGLVGYSLGAQTAAVLAGAEPRLKAVGLMAGRANPVTTYWIRRTHAHLFVQGGSRDTRVSPASVRRLAAAAPGRPRLAFYPAGHSLSRRASDEQVAWQAAELGLR